MFRWYCTHIFSFAIVLTLLSSSCLVGDDVEADQPLVILEAMKMEHVIKATKSGVISKVHYTSGEFVEDGRELISIGSEDAKN